MCKRNHGFSDMKTNPESPAHTRTANCPRPHHCPQHETVARPHQKYAQMEAWATLSISNEDAVRNAARHIYAAQSTIPTSLSVLEYITKNTALGAGIIFFYFFCILHKSTCIWRCTTLMGCSAMDDGNKVASLGPTNSFKVTYTRTRKEKKTLAILGLKN